MTPLGILEVSPERATLPIGAAGPAFEGLLGTDGRRHGFSSVADREAVALIFSSNRCPTAKAYAERMNALQRDYGARGVQLLAINANDPHLQPDESYPRMVERAFEDGYQFPYVVDDGQRVARAYGAICTFHVFVLDGERRLRYQGRFDDSRLAARVTTDDLRNARF
jgi:disulfide oxidoreductase YuzD